MHGFADFTPVAHRMKGLNKTFRVEGLTGVHEVDQRLIKEHIAGVKGWTVGQVEDYMRVKDLRMHHAWENAVQLVPTSIHANVPHTGGAAWLRALGQYYWTK